MNSARIIILLGVMEQYRENIKAFVLEKINCSVTYEDNVNCIGQKIGILINDEQKCGYIIEYTREQHIVVKLEKGVEFCIHIQLVQPTKYPRGISGLAKCNQLAAGSPTIRYNLEIIGPANSRVPTCAELLELDQIRASISLMNSQHSKLSAKIIKDKSELRWGHIDIEETDGKYYPVGKRPFGAGKKKTTRHIHISKEAYDAIELQERERSNLEAEIEKMHSKCCELYTQIYRKD